MVRRRNMAFAVVATMLMGACATQEKGVPVEGESPSDAPSGELSPEEIQGKLVAGAPPDDLIWNYPKLPAQWQELGAEPGTVQWKVGESQCVVTLTQPDGLGADPSPDSAKVARDYAERSAEAANAEPSHDQTSKQMFPGLVNANNIQVQVDVRKVHFSDESKRIQGDSYGYRAGDFALSAVVMCGDGDYAKESAAILEFVEHDLVVKMKYS